MSTLEAPLSQEKDMLLASARAGDNDACERMLEENAGLIWSIVRRYYGRGVDPEDLYQLGCLGFLKAVRGFDPAFGCQFSTYAVPKIAGEIRRFLRDDGAVKVSRGIKERGMTIRLARDKLGHMLGRDPTLSELSEETGLEPEDIGDMLTGGFDIICRTGLHCAPLVFPGVHPGHGGHGGGSGGTSRPARRHRRSAGAGTAGHFSAVL